MNASFLLMLGGLSIAGGTTPKIVCVEVHSAIAQRPGASATTPQVVLCSDPKCTPLVATTVVCEPVRCDLGQCTSKCTTVQGNPVVCVPSQNGASPLGQVATCVPAQGCNGPAVVQVVPGGETRFFVGGSHSPKGLAYRGALTLSASAGTNSVSNPTVLSLQQPSIAPQTTIEVETVDEPETMDAVDAPDEVDMPDDADEPEEADEPGEMSFRFELPEGFDAAMEQAQQATQDQVKELREVLERAQQTAHEAQDQAREAMRGASEKAREAYQHVLEAQQEQREVEARQHLSDNDDPIARLRLAKALKTDETLSRKIAEKALKSAEVTLRGLSQPGALGYVGESDKVAAEGLAARADEERAETERAQVRHRAQDRGDLESRVAELERFAKQSGQKLRAKVSGDGAEPSLEDRVSELERLLRGKSKSVRKTPGFGVFSVPAPEAGATPPAQPHVWKFPGVGGTGGGLSLGPDYWKSGTLVRPSTPAAPRAPRILRVPGAPGATAAPGAPGAPTTPPPSAPKAFAAPATPPAGTAPGYPWWSPGTPPSPTTDARREEIQRAMSELRAEAERLRAEMARMREEIERLPRNQAR